MGGEIKRNILKQISFIFLVFGLPFAPAQRGAVGPSRTRRMDWKTAEKDVNLIADFPADCLTVEFAGGEPLLEFDLVKRVVNYARDWASYRGKAIQFLTRTNAALITAPLAQLIKDLDIQVGHEMTPFSTIGRTMLLTPGLLSR